MTGIKIDHKKVEEFCRINKIEFLGVFGSVTRDDFGSKSDVDLLVRYMNGEYPSLFEKSKITDQLKVELGRNVDLVAQEFVDPLIRDRIYSDLTPLYGNP